MRLIYLLSVLLFSAPVFAEKTFDTYFNGKRLRIDFALSGNADSQSAALVQLREEPLWGGPHKNLIDPFEYGGYMLKAYDKESGELIYSRGFNTLFEEWRTTDRASKETQSWNNTIVMPFPHKTISIALLARNRSTNLFEPLMEMEIDPSDISIDRGSLEHHSVTEIQTKGPSSTKTDLVFLAEGYTTAEKDKFLADAQRFTDSLLAFPPFDQCRDDFNIRAVFLESKETGTDFSGKGVFVHTALNSGFYTFGSERYLTTPDMRSVRDAVWNTPCDAIFILVNSDVYGGGGMYNFYAIGTADNERTIEVFVHELGHSFAGLADEYFLSGTSYNDFYNLKLEPWEPNITTLVNFERKWKNRLPAGTPVPTPVNDVYKQCLGVFEGGGYVEKGIYRPANHCMMRDLKAFCPVCCKAILQMSDFLSDKEIQ